jgi:hypothetical protein
VLVDLLVATRGNFVQNAAERLTELAHQSIIVVWRSRAI